MLSAWELGLSPAAYTLVMLPVFMFYTSSTIDHLNRFKLQTSGSACKCHSNWIWIGFSFCLVIRENSHECENVHTLNETFRCGSKMPC